MNAQHLCVLALSVSLLGGCGPGEASTPPESPSSVLLELPAETSLVLSADLRRLPSATRILFGQMRKQAPVMAQVDRFLESCVVGPDSGVESLVLAWPATGDEFGIVAKGRLAASHLKDCAREVSLPDSGATPDAHTFILAGSAWLPQMLDLHREPLVEKSAASNAALMTRVPTANAGAMWWAGELPITSRESVATALALPQSKAIRAISGTLGGADGISLVLHVELDHPARAASVAANLRANLASLRGPASAELTAYLNAVSVRAEQAGLVLQVEFSAAQLKALAEVGPHSQEPSAMASLSEYYCGVATMCTMPPVPVLICQDRYCNYGGCTVRSTTYPCGGCWGFGDNTWTFIPPERKCS